MIVVELNAAVNEAGASTTFYLADRLFATEPTDTPPNQAFDGVLIDAGSIGLHVFADGRTGGGTLLETGEIRIANADGEYDAWKDYAFDGRPVVIRHGNEGAAYPGGFTTLLTGVAVSVDVGLSEVVVSLKDKAAILDRPVLSRRFAGTNSGPTGLEGLASDIKGQVVPRAYGIERNIAPPMVNSALQIFRASDRPLAALSKVYDRGGEKAFGEDHANSTALAAATIAGGEFDTCLAEGLFRLNSTLAGTVTADVAAFTDAVDMSAGALLAQLATDAGLTDAEINADDIAELKFAAPYALSLYIDDETTFRDAMDRVCVSVGAWYAFDAPGVLRCGRLEEPAAVADGDVLEEEIDAAFERLTGERSGVPVWRVVLRYGRNYTVQTSDLDGSVSDERRAALAQDYLTVTQEDAAVKVQFTQAGELVVDTLLADGEDAEDEAARLLALYKVRRDLFSVPIHLSRNGDDPRELMSTQSITHGRLGLAAGRNLRVLGRGLELAEDQIILKVWG